LGDRYKAEGRRQKGSKAEGRRQRAEGKRGMWKRLDRIGIVSRFTGTTL